MEPVVFNDCFGWLHAAQGRHGVVLCNPFGYDAYCTHRGWRKLAEGIAAAGMPTLRFDYPGTGDSAGWEDDPRRIDAWLESIEAAVRWLRAKADLERVSLVGFRLGATLAALAAERIGDIDGLVLMAPVVSGSIYVRELRAHRRIWRRASPYLNVEPVDETDGYVEVYGFGLRGEDIAEIGALDLRHDTGAPARRVLILDTNQRGSSGALAERYVSQGVMVEQDSFDEFERFLVEPVQSTTPAEAFTRATQWLAAEDAPLPMQARGFAQPEQSDTLRLPHSQATEQPVVFDRYFGIYCEPDAPQFDAPAVLIVNTGAGHHIGDGRLSVLLARRLATVGIASLRMDLGGLGDAMPSAEAITVESIFSENACSDAAAGVDWLVARGHERVVAFGVCSGAYIGLHVCARHPAVAGAYAINLPKFTWRAVVHGARKPEFSSLKEYRHSVLDLQKWLKACRGQSHLLLIARELCRRVLRYGSFAARRRILRSIDDAIADSEVRGLIRTLRAKRAYVRMVYGEFDVGVDEAKAQFGTDFSVLRACPNIHAVILPKLDHSLFSRDARSVSLADVERWLHCDLMGSK